MITTRDDPVPNVTVHQRPPTISDIAKTGPPATGSPQNSLEPGAMYITVVIESMSLVVDAATMSETISDI